ncbi:MAG TPA: Calx-beta domain-containing protein, partial [Verrucomicrobiae bacterium]|nr:Calx-beta domain-containing protein [Verrucomicrobiae bacterium]
MNDALLNASSPVTISASANGYYALSTVVIVDDDETAGLRLRIPAKANEGDGTLAKQGSIRLSRKADADLRISLFSSDPAAVAVPSFVIVAAGDSSGVFDLQIGDDQNLTGPRTIRITAHVENWVDDFGDIVIADNETAALILKVPARLSEGNGTLTNIAAVQLSGIVSSNVQVSLTSGSAAQIQVPASVIVPAGQTTAAFDVTVFDDAIVNGLRMISITATAPGFASTTASIGLIDDETAPIPYQPLPPDGASEIGISTNLSWHPGFGEILVNGGFETGDFTGWQFENSDYGSFVINDGKIDPEGAENPTPPYDGKFSVVTSQVGSGKHVLYQDIFIPDEARSARLSWVDMIRNYATDFVPFTTEFRVELRNPANTVLATIFVTNPGDKLTNVWTRRSFDISQFRGQTIRVAFIEQDLTSYFNLHLDDISVFLGTSGTPSFDVYFGTTSTLKAADLKGATTNTFWPLPQLALNTTYYWQIMEHLGPTTSAGPIWRFTTRGIGPTDHFEWSPIASSQELNRAFPVTLTARDDIGNVATNFSGPVQLSAISGPATASAIVITEIDTGSNDSIEFQNVSGRAIDISSWKMTVWDGRSWPAPRVTITIPTNTVCPSGRIFQLFRAGTAPGTFPVFYTGLTLFWNNNVVGNNLAVLLRDADNNIVDFVCAYGADPAEIKDPLAIPHAEWLGNSIPAPSDGLLTFQRVGQTDHNNASDWTTTTNSIGRRNPGLLLPFQPLNAIPLLPSAPSLISGVWTGQLTVQEVVSNLTLLAADRSGHVGFSSRFDVIAQNDLALDVGYSPDLTIPGNQINYLLTVRNSGPLASTGVLLTNHLPENAQFVSATPSQGQCGLLNGILFCSLGTLEGTSNASIAVVISSTAAGPLTNVFGVVRNEPEGYFSNNIARAVSTVDLPLIAINDVTVNEGNSGTVDATLTVRLSAPSTLPVSVSFSTSNRTATAGLDYIATSGVIAFPPGSTNQPL